MNAWRFEIINESGDVEYVEVRKVMTHHYTKEEMRVIMVQGVYPDTGNGYVKYDVLSEDEFNKLLERRKI